MINTGIGGISQAVILLAQKIGAVVLAKVPHRADKDLLIERFGIPSERILLSKGVSLKESLLRWINGRGVDLFLHCSTEDIPAGVSCYLAPYGTLIHIRASPVSSKMQTRTVLLGENVTLVSFDPVSFVRDRPYEATQSTAIVMSEFESGMIRHKPYVTVFPVAAIDNAFRDIQAGDATGKVVLDATQDSMVKTISAIRPTLHLNGKAAYVIAGGLGDFGRRISRLMVTRGAKNIFVLPRTTLVAASVNCR